MGGLKAIGESFRNWWQGRLPRERALLLIMAGLALLVLPWLLVLRPLGDALSYEKERHAQAVIAHFEARAAADEIRRLEKTMTPRMGKPLVTMLSDSAAGVGFQVTGLEEAGPGAVRLKMAAARPQAFFGWVSQMEAQGLIVHQLSATPNADQTIAVEVMFREPRKA